MTQLRRYLLWCTMTAKEYIQINARFDSLQGKTGKGAVGLTESRLAWLNLHGSPDHRAYVQRVLWKPRKMRLVEDQGHLLVGLCVRKEVLRPSGMFRYMRSDKARIKDISR